MSRNSIKYEVRVEVDNPGSERYEVVPYLKGMYVTDKEIRMFHIYARTHDQAAEKGKKHGRVISVRKPQVDKMLGDIENINLQEPLGVYAQGNPFKDAVAMDEMIWKKQNKKRKNKHKDKIAVTDIQESFHE